MENNIYQVTKIAEGTYKIDECSRDICYLLLGTKKALLIDCSIGTGDLKGVVRSLTDLPVVVAATHAHADHTGGAWQFGEVWVHKSECRFIFKITNCRLMRASILSNKMKRNGITASKIKGSIFQRRFLPFEDGKTFELGERTVTAHHTPGHSPGSVVFTDSREKLMFTGDNTCPFLLMKVLFATSLEKWLVGAQKTAELAKEYHPWCAHGDGKQSQEQIENTIALAKQIIKERKRNTFFHKKVFYPKFDPKGCIAYDTAKIK